jgi:hypothetical protein
VDKYKANIVPCNGFMGTYWVVYLSRNGRAFDSSTHYNFSVAQNIYETLKKRAEYLNKETE